jgi:hypothetical protein
MNRSFIAVLSQISLWEIVYVLNVGAWVMHEEFSMRCPHGMWFLLGECHAWYGKQAIEHFEQMCEGVEVNNVTFVCLLSDCSQAGLSQYICST